jgi:hypothetical protein
MIDHGYSKEAVKFALITEHKELYTTAMELLSSLPQVTHDKLMRQVFFNIWRFTV